MQALLFLSRVTFICNICYGILWVLYFYPVKGNLHAVATIWIMGMFLSLALNVIVNLSIIVLLFMRKPLWQTLPKWLVVANGIFFIVQIITFFE